MRLINAKCRYTNLICVNIDKTDYVQKIPCVDCNNYKPEEIKKYIPRTRRTELIDQRNRFLSARFYWYDHIRKLKYSYVLEQLQVEFYIKERNIMNILNDLNDYVNELVVNETTTKQLAKMYPRFNWDIK